MAKRPSWVVARAPERLRLPSHELTLAIGCWDPLRWTKKDLRLDNYNQKISLNALCSQGGFMLGSALVKDRS